jgi:hydroxymethylpyrimidine/phosphomethylpyrimidine kinase
MSSEKKILIIAGSDSCGGAGIQADIKTATALHTYSSTAITCLTNQNTQKVYNINYTPVAILSEQIKVLLDDINFDVIKIGMLGNQEIIDCVHKALLKKFKKIPIILDPVMVATSGDLLFDKSAINDLKLKLISKCFMVTPNIDEAKVLSGINIKNISDMREAASEIKTNLGCKTVLVKGGHLNFTDGKIHNVFLDNDHKFHIISNKKINAKKLHGTGCTLATAIACYLAKKPEKELWAVKKANNYVYEAVDNFLNVGKGSLVLQHWL